MALERPAATTRLGKYELIKEQAGSGVASTWIARASDSDALLSILRVHRHVIKKTEHVEAFLSDAKRAQALKHPNVVAFVDVGVNDGEVFVVLEHLEGEVLSSLVTQAGASGLEQPVALRIARDALLGLAAGHDLGEPLPHGEFGPHQIRVGVDGVSRVSGFGVASGLARMGTHGVKNHDRLAYAAPERVKSMAAGGAGAAIAPDIKSDVFSAAVMLWELLAKQRLFASKIEAAVIQKVLTAPVATLTSLPGVDVPASLDEAVQRGLARDPAHRAASVRELIDAIDASGVTLATDDEIGAIVDKFAGKAIATRKQELEDATTARLNGSTLSARPPSRKTTLMGFAPPSEPPPPVSVKSPTPSPVATKSASTESAISLDDEWVKSAVTDAGSVAPKPPLPPRKVAATMLGLPPLGGETQSPTEERLSKKPPPPPPKRSGANTLMLGSLGALEDAPTKAEPMFAKLDLPKPAAKAEDAKKQTTPEPARANGDHPLDDPGSDSVSSGSGKRRGPAASALDKVHPGTTLGRYEILMPIGRGGMASVWAGRMQGSRGFSRIVAIKTMLPDISDDPDFQKMFLDEARVAAKIRHPNVCQILDLGEQDDVLYLVMDWIEGETLGTLQKASKPLGGIPLPIALRIASQALGGLHAAHELREDGALLEVVHRDVSPGNVLVSMQGFVKIVDFGIAKSKGRLHVTRAGGLVKGKTPYLSPEQLGQLPIDRRSDIFSFGCLLYVLTTGLHPFRGETEVKTVENIAIKAPMPPRELNPSIPVELDTLILKTLEKDASKRYSTAAELQKVINSIAATLEPTSDEDVAEFVRKAIGDLQAKRSQELKTAIAALEEGGPKSTTAKPAEVSAASKEKDKDKDDAIVPSRILALGETSDASAVEAEAAAPELAIDLPDELVDVSPRVQPSSPPDAERLSGQDGQAFEPKRRANLKLIVGAAIGVCALVGIAAIVSSGGSKPTSGAATSDVTAAQAAPTAPPPDTGAAAQASAPATAEAAPTAAPTAEASAAPEPSATAEATAEPADAKPTKGSRPVGGAKPAAAKAAPAAAAPRPAAPKPAAPPPRPAPAPKKYNPSSI